MFGYDLLYEKLNNLPDQYLKTSADYKIGFSVSNFSISSSTTTFTFYILKNKTYQPITINIASQIAGLGLDSISNYTTRINFSENGKFAVINVIPPNNTSVFDGINKAIFIEIDSENETATPYLVTIPHNITTGGYGGTFKVFGDYLIQHCYPNNSSILYSYKYDYETHSLLELASFTTSSSQIYQTLFGITEQYQWERIAWLDENTVICHPNYNNQTYARRLIKIEFGISSLNIIYNTITTTSSSSSVTLSGDGKTIGAWVNTGIYEIGTINLNDLSVSYITNSAQVTGQLRIYGNKIITGSSTSLNLYEIGNADVTLLHTFTFPVAISSFSTYNTTPFFDFDKITCYNESVSICYLFRVLIQNGEYVISPSAGGLIQSNKYYGLVPDDITFGNTSNVQLLWNSIENLP